MIVRWAANVAPGARASLDASLLYVVLEVYIGGTDLSVRVYDPNEPQGPTIWSMADCQLVDSTVAPNWTLAQGDGSVTLGPASWRADDYWLRFWEGDIGTVEDSDVLRIGLSPDLPVLSWSRRADDVHALYRQELHVILAASGFTVDGGTEQFRIPDE